VATPVFDDEYEIVPMPPRAMRVDSAPGGTPLTIHHAGDAW
jgi:hypothetical protein